MSDGLQLQSIALPDITELEAATASAAINRVERAAAGGSSDSDSDWSVMSTSPSTLRHSTVLAIVYSFVPTLMCRSDSGDNGHGPPLRQSVIAPAVPDLHKSREDERRDTFTTADDFEDDGPAFSASIHATVAHTAHAPHVDSDEDSSDVRATDTVQPSGALSMPPQDASDSLVLKAGWLRKLARYGRDMKRCDRTEFACLFISCSPRVAAAVFARASAVMRVQILRHCAHRPRPSDAAAATRPPVHRAARSRNLLLR